MGVLAPSYPVVPDTILVDYMNRFLSTTEGQAVAEQFVAAGVQSYFIANPVEDDIASSVATYLAANPPANGQNATAGQVQEAVDAYFAMYPPQAGPQGETGPVGPAGQSITQEQLAAAVAAYLQANPPQPGATGPAGQNATDEQVAQAVAAYIAVNPLTGAVLQAIAAYFAQNPEPVPATATPLADSGNGNAGTSTKYAREDHRHPASGPNPSTAAPPPVGSAAQGASARYAREDHTHALPALTTYNALLGQVTIGQNATVAIALGIREITVALSGAVVGERYLPFVRSYRLNNGASTPGRPPGYAIIDAVCNTANQITVSLSAPLLAIGSSYALTVDIVKVNI